MTQPIFRILRTVRLATPGCLFVYKAKDIALFCVLNCFWRDAAGKLNETGVSKPMPDGRTGLTSVVQKYQGLTG